MIKLTIACCGQVCDTAYKVGTALEGTRDSRVLIGVWGR